MLLWSIGCCSIGVALLLYCFIGCFSVAAPVPAPALTPREACPLPGAAVQGGTYRQWDGGSAPADEPEHDVTENDGDDTPPELIDWPGQGMYR